MKIKILKQYQIPQGTPVNVGDGIVLEATEKTTLYEEIWSCSQKHITRWFIDWFMNDNNPEDEQITYCFKEDLFNQINRKTWYVLDARTMYHLNNLLKVDTGGTGVLMLKTEK